MGDLCCWGDCRYFRARHDLSWSDHSGTWECIPLRAQNGGSQSRLAFNLESLTQQKTNMRAALGRIVDVDIAEESTNVAKYSILNQAAASMLAQANASMDVALMLLR